MGSGASITKPDVEVNFFEWLTKVKGEKIFKKYYLQDNYEFLERIEANEEKNYSVYVVQQKGFSVEYAMKVTAFEEKCNNFKKFNGRELTSILVKSEEAFEEDLKEDEMEVELAKPIQSMEDFIEAYEENKQEFSTNLMLQKKLGMDSGVAKIFNIWFEIFFDESNKKLIYFCYQLMELGGDNLEIFLSEKRRQREIIRHFPKVFWEILEHLTKFESMGIQYNDLNLQNIITPSLDSDFFKNGTTKFINFHSEEIKMEEKKGEIDRKKLKGVVEHILDIIGKGRRGEPDPIEEYENVYQLFCNFFKALDSASTFEEFSELFVQEAQLLGIKYLNIVDPVVEKHLTTQDEKLVEQEAKFNEQEEKFNEQEERLNEQEKKIKELTKVLSSINLSKAALDENKNEKEEIRDSSGDIKEEKSQVRNDLPKKRKKGKSTSSIKKKSKSNQKKKKEVKIRKTGRIIRTIFVYGKPKIKVALPTLNTQPKYKRTPKKSKKGNKTPTKRIQKSKSTKKIKNSKSLPQIASKYRDNNSPYASPNRRKRKRFKDSVSNSKKAQKSKIFMDDKFTNTN